MKIGDEILVHGFIDEIRKDTVIVRNDGGYFGTSKTEIKPLQTDIVRCGVCKHYGNEMLGWCYEMNRITSADKFCSYGERSK